MEYKTKNGQKYPAKTRHIDKQAFEASPETTIYWLGNAGAMINCRGTVLMIDPLLEGFDMSLLIDMPISAKEVPHMDAVLITHCDNDHFSKDTCHAMSNVCDAFYTTKYVAELFDAIGIKAQGCDIHESFQVGNVKATLTPADHAWQNESPSHKTRDFKMEDYCGFWMDTPDGSIWAVGDSRLLEEQLHMPHPKVMLFDFSDSVWHIGLKGAVELANAHPDAILIPWHWGSVEAPDMKEFNGDPEQLKRLIVNPDRVQVLAPGEAFTL